MFDSVCCSHLGAIVTMHLASMWGSVQCPSPAGSTISQIVAASSKVVHVQVLRDICIYIGSQNRVIDTALLFAPGSACLLTFLLPCCIPPLPCSADVLCHQGSSRQMRLASCRLQDNTLAGTLANVCNTINYDNNIVCQGFVYDNQQKVAFFKGGTNGQPVTTGSVLCSSPTGTAWLRDTGRTIQC